MDDFCGLCHLSWGKENEKHYQEINKIIHSSKDELNVKENIIIYCREQSIEINDTMLDEHLMGLHELSPEKCLSEMKKRNDELIELIRNEIQRVKKECNLESEKIFNNENNEIDNSALNRYIKLNNSLMDLYKIPLKIYK